MCLICLYFQAEKLNPVEALNNLEEMAEEIGPAHTREVVEMIIESEIQRIETDFENNIDENQIIPIDFGGKELAFLE